MKITPLVTLAFVATMALAHPAHAQETTAAGTLSHEASWSALQTLINQTKGDLKLVRTDVEAGKTCGKSNQIWNPNKGCVDSHVDLSELEKIKVCGNQGKVYGPTATGADTKTGCVSVKTPAPTCTSNLTMVIVNPRNFSNPDPRTALEAKGYTCVATGASDVAGRARDVTYEADYHICQKITCK